MTNLDMNRKSTEPANGIWRDVTEIRDAVERYLAGELPEDDFRHFRVMRGIYSQRQPGVHMVRVRVPLGRLTACQARRLAALAREFGSGKAHITTRQDIQLYYVPTAEVPEVVRQLALVGLTTRESGGSSTRNVTTCPMAGVCPRQHIDVTPIAEAVGRHFLRHPLVQNLPRKFKVALSGCERDCALAGINDTGFIANPDGTFRMMVAGGLGATPEAAFPLDNHLPASEVLPMTEAVVQVFDRHGDRKNRQRARLKFVARRLGSDSLADEIRRERAFVTSLPQTVETEPGIPPVPVAAEAPLPGYEAWRAKAALEQRQTGFFTVRVFARRGDLSPESLLALADAAEQLGNNSIRVTVAQGVLLTWVPGDNLPALHRRLSAAGLAEPYAGTIADVVSCPASATCRLGVTRGTDAADALIEALKPLAHDPDLKSASVKVSGCPNSCAHHHLATIGMHGAAATVDGRKVPCYQVLVGGTPASGVALGRRLAKVPAGRIAEVVLRLVSLYRANRTEDEPLGAFFQRIEIGWLQDQIQDLTDLRPRPGEEESFFVDLGDTEPFRVDTADGECAV